MPKVCFKCGEKKSLAMFYRHPGMADGHLNKCKECAKADAREHRRDNDSVREYDRKRSKENRERMKAHRESSVIWKKKNKVKVLAHYAVGRAIKLGSIKRLQCEECGDKNSEAHHDDYSKPLVVRWLCHLCHMRHHHSK